MKKAIASPVRAGKSLGMFYFEVTAIKYPDGRMCCGYAGTGRTYELAKADFWQQWKDKNPDVFLEIKLSNG